LEIEVRRLQRLGASSIVVTLPKEWANRLGLQPGDKVMLVDEGDSIRVVPVDRRAGEGVTLDLSRLDPELAIAAPTCLYLSGLDGATIRLPPGGDLVEEMKRRSMLFTGVQVYEQAPGEARVEILIDVDRVDISSLLRSMSRTMSRLVSLLEEALQGGTTAPGERAELLRQDFLRTLYVVLRYLVSRHAKTADLLENYQTALAASYIGLATDLLQDILDTSGRLGLQAGLSGEDKKLLLRILAPLEDAVGLLLRLLASPSASRLATMYRSLEQARLAAEEAMRSVSSPAAGVLAGKLHDVLRLLNIAAYVATCRVILRAAGREG